MSGQGGTSGARFADGAPDDFVARALRVLDREAPPAPAGVPALETLRAQARQWIDDLLALVAGGGAGSGLPPPPATLAAPIAPAPLAAAMSDASALLAVLAPAAPVKPGDIVRLPLRLANDALAEAPISLVATDLIAASGDRIPASALSFWPEQSLLRPGGQAAIEIKVTVPAQLPPGRYGGLVQVVGQPEARSLLTISVG